MPPKLAWITSFALVTFVGLVPYGEFRGDDHLISTIAFRHPLANPRLRLLILVVAGCVDEIISIAQTRVSLVKANDAGSIGPT
jgi:hypothetical protein